MKKRMSRYEEKLHEVYHLTEVLHKEGKSIAECRYYEFMAELLLATDESFRVIHTVLFFLLGSQIANLLDKLIF